LKQRACARPITAPSAARYSQLYSHLTSRSSEVTAIELELQRLIEENQSLISHNEDLQTELMRLKSNSMEHIEAMERELEVKCANARETEAQLRELQEQFI